MAAIYNKVYSFNSYVELLWYQLSFNRRQLLALCKLSCFEIVKLNALYATLTL